MAPGLVVSRRPVAPVVFAVTLTALLIAPRIGAAPPPRQAPAAADCVALGSPKPNLLYVHRYSDTSGSTDYSNQWQQFTPTGSRLVTTKIAPSVGQSTYVSQHRVADDVFVLEASTAAGTDAGGAFKNAMAYKPGAIGDPAYKACAGKTWTIPAVTATSQSLQGTFSMKTDPGVMTIIKVHESITVPAGTFDTVHYMKTMNSGRGQLVDEFWKSIEHGVTVKRNSRQPGGIAVEVLTAIK